MVPHHFLLIWLGDVGDIVPSGLHELVQLNLGCLLIKLQEQLCLSFTVQLICRERDRVVWGSPAPAPSPYLIPGPFGSLSYLNPDHPQS